MTERTPSQASVLDNPKLQYFRDNLMGLRSTIRTPYGEKNRHYFDYIASGVPFQPIEDLLYQRVLPHMANTHTESNSSGRQITQFVEDAYQKVGRSIGSNDDDVIVFTGGGSTAAINRLILAMGLRLPEQIAERCCDDCSLIDNDDRPIVFRSLMEHHSNDIAWRETIAETRFVGFDKQGRIDWRDLERQLKDPAVKNRRLLVGTFSAASNVTGIINDVDPLAQVMHEYGGYAFFDYAAAAPYVKVDMHPDENDAKRKDAVFISTHKFIGGPQAPGILAANKALFTSNVPVEPGGGTVLYTSPWDHRYLDDVKVREGGGTPPIIQIIRAGLVFELKDYIGDKLLLEAEHELIDVARERFSSNQAITLLGNLSVDRLGVFSVVFHDGKLHHNLAVRLLNDLFGIQVRAGCMCAGSYGHALLDIDQDTSQSIRNALDRGEIWTKPGWVRISVSPATSRKELDYLLDAVDTVARDWEQYVDKYRQDDMGEWFWAGTDFEERFEPLTLDVPTP